MGCATGLVKYLVFIANLIFALAGLALVIIGVLYKFNYNDATKALPQDFGLAPILSIIIGAIVFITAFLGCCGAVKESSCMLTTYSIILLTIFIIQVAIGVYTFLKIKDSNEFHRQIETFVQQTFDQYGKNPEKTEAVDVTQRFLHCCGADSYSSMTFPNGSLPLSCCKEGVHHCRSTDFGSFYDRGCARTLYEFLESSSQVVGGVAIGVAVIELKCCGTFGPDYYSQTLPKSCCYGNKDNCIIGNPEVYHDGCIKNLEEFLYTGVNIIGGTAIGVSAIELIGAVLALFLANSIRNHHRLYMHA